MNSALRELPDLFGYVIAICLRKHHSTNSGPLKVECRVHSLIFIYIINVRKAYPKWVIFLYGPIFRVIGFFYRVYTANRTRLQKLKANETVSSLIKFTTILILLGWLLTWYLASEESRDSLVDDVKQSIGGLKSSVDE